MTYEDSGVPTDEGARKQLWLIGVKTMLAVVALGTVVWVVVTRVLL
jgi:hypothetical protein